MLQGMIWEYVIVWIIIAASIVVGVIATTAIVIAIISGLKKTGDAISAYAQAQLTIGANRPNPNQVYTHDNPTYLTKPNMEQFLSDIAKEKPIRLYPKSSRKSPTTFHRYVQHKNSCFL